MKNMRFDVFSLFPEVFTPYLEASILQRAQQRSLVEVRLHNIRDWATDRHHITDDTPYGGGGGMVMKPEPIFAAVESVLGTPPACPVILMTLKAGCSTILSPRSWLVTNTWRFYAADMKGWMNEFASTW
jgi:tRNA (guanine-N1)-methyltransferase